MENIQKGFVVPLVIVIVTLLTIGGGIYMASQKKVVPAMIPNQELPNLEITDSKTTATQPKDTPSSTQPPQETSFLLNSTSVKPYEIEVNWQKQLTDVTVDCDGQPECDYSKNYLAGQIINGGLGGYLIFLRERGVMGASYDHYIVFPDGKKFYLEENKFTIKGISNLPEEITFPGSTHKMMKHEDSPSILFKDTSPREKLFTINDLGDFYLTDFQCVMVELSNHTGIAYDFEMPFISEGGEIDLTFKNGIKNTELYNFKRTDIGKYGQPPCIILAIGSEVKGGGESSETAYTLAGKTSNGEDFYEYKDPNNITLETLYNDKNTIAYTNGAQKLPTNKYTYEEFINYHPLIYWEDPLGRRIEFRNIRFLPQPWY